MFYTQGQNVMERNKNRDNEKKKFCGAENESVERNSAKLQELYLSNNIIIMSESNITIATEKW